MADTMKPIENCPNCSTPWPEGANFCSNCGQDKHSYRKSFGHLVLEFFETLFHFDTKALQTFKVMFLKPGQLTLDFLDGKRARYVPPFRLYIFLSVIYFFLLATFPPKEMTKDGLVKFTQTESDTITVSDGWKIKVNGEEKLTIGESVEGLNKIDSLTPHTRAEEVLYGFLKKIRKATPAEVNQQFFSMFSKILFLLMPLFALILKLLYVRRKRLYFDHLVFAIHTHTQAILLLLIALLLSMLFPGIEFARFALGILLVYLFLGIKRMYGQTWGKTVVKFTLLIVLYGVVMGIGFISSLLLGISTLH